MTEPGWRTLEPYWAAQGRYGYWAVDEYRRNDPHHGTYDTAVGGRFRSKKQAQAVADALNTAYARGKKGAGGVGT